MKLTNYILDLGRVVAFYPGLKRITYSTTATILLCQFLYWCSRTKNDGGWIYKTAIEIEEETGLSYDEQTTARKKLLALGLMEEENKRLDHTMRYRINQEELNRQWEESYGESTPYKKEEANPPGEESAEDYFTRKTAEKPPQKVYDHSAPKKQGDLVDGVLSKSKMSGMKKTERLLAIRETLEKKFHVIARNKKWEDFIGFIFEREQLGESVDTFIEWAAKEGFNPIYWTPDKMTTLWPGAFVNNDNGIQEDFVKQLPHREENEEEYAPMPESLKRRRINLE